MKNSNKKAPPWWQMTSAYLLLAMYCFLIILDEAVGWLFRIENHIERWVKQWRGQGK